MSDLLILHHLQVLQSELRKVDKSIIYHPVKQNELNFSFSTIKKWYQSQHQFSDPFCLDQLNSTFDIHQKQKKNLTLLAMTHPRSFHVYTVSNVNEIPQVEPLDTCIGMLRYLQYERHTTLSAHHVLMPFFQSLNSSSKISLVALSAILEILPTLQEFNDFQFCVKITSYYLTKLVPKGNEDVLGILQFFLDIFNLLLNYKMDSEQYTWWISTLLGYIVGKLPDGLKMQAEHSIFQLILKQWDNPSSLSTLLRILLSPILPKSPFTVYFNNLKFKTLFFDFNSFSTNGIETTELVDIQVDVSSEALQLYTMRLLQRLYSHNQSITPLDNNSYISQCIRINGIYSLFRILYNPSTVFPIRFQAFKSLQFIVLDNVQQYQSECYIFVNFLIDAINLLGPLPSTLTHPRVSQSKFKPRNNQYHPNSSMSANSSLYSPFNQIDEPFTNNMPRTYPLWVAMQAVESGDVVYNWSYTRLFLHWFESVCDQLNLHDFENADKEANGQCQTTLNITKPNEIPDILFKRMWHSHGLLHYYFKNYSGPFTYIGHGVVYKQADKLHYFEQLGQYPPASFLKSFQVSQQAQQTINSPSDNKRSSIDSSKHTSGKHVYCRDPDTPKHQESRIAVSNEVVEWRNALMSCIEQIFVDNKLLLHLANKYDYNDGDDIFQRLITIVHKYCMPDYANVCNRSFCAISLNSFIRVLKHLTDNQSSSISYEDTLMLSNKLKRQHLLKQCCRIFKRDLKLGLNEFIKHGFLPDDLEPQQFATFLKQCRLLNKYRIGELLGKPSNVLVLKHFVSTFDFQNDRIDEALRDFLSSFRLPGESQQIERILEYFSEHYYSYKPQYINDKDAVLVLSYAIVILNTDRHSPQIKNRMTLQQFQNNLRGTNDKENFDAVFLTSIYNGISNNEIVMPGEKDNSETYFLFWDEVCKKHINNNTRATSNSQILEKCLFMDNWGLFLTTLINCWDFCDDEYTLQLIVQGFHHYAQLSDGDSIDAMIMALCCMSGIYPGYSYAMDNTTITNELGGYFKGQLALYMLSIFISKYHSKIKAWDHVICLIKRLYLGGLLNSSLAATDFFPSNEESMSNTTSLFSTFTSYFNINTSPNTSPSQEDNKNVGRFAVKCLLECNFNDLLMKCNINDLLEHYLRHSVETIDKKSTLSPFSLYAVSMIISQFLEINEFATIKPFIEYMMKANPLLAFHVSSSFLELYTNGYDHEKDINREFEDFNMNCINTLLETDLPIINVIGYVKPILSRFYNSQSFIQWFNDLSSHITFDTVLLSSVQEFLFKLGKNGQDLKVVELITHILAILISNAGDTKSKLHGQYLDLLYHAVDTENSSEIVESLLTHVYCQDSDVRQKAWFYLQRIVQNPEDSLFETLFTRFDFKKVDNEELMDELRMRATAIVCKTYLIGNDYNVDVLIKIIRLLKGYYTGVIMMEIIPEAIKNILLIMMDIGDIDEEVWEELEFIPNLKSDLLKQELPKTVNNTDRAENENRELEEAKMDPSKPIYI